MTVIDPYTPATVYSPVRFLHRLNPLSKIAAPLPAMIFLIVARGIPLPLAFLLLGLVIVFVGTHLNPRMAFVLLVGFPALAVFFAFSFGIWTDPTVVDRSVVLLQIGDYRLYLGSLALGLGTSLRLLALFSLTLIAGLSTTGPDLVRSMVQQLRVPYRIGYTALAAFRFVPRFGHELAVIRSAHRVRGMTGGRGPIAAIRRSFRYVVPLLAGAIRHAERVALAMDSRAFGAHSTRTERYVVPFRARDWAFIALSWAATAAIILFVPLLELP